MVSLSPGGSDASEQREFDTRTKQFVAGGFSLPEAKSSVAWRDEDTLWVGTDFGPGSLTTSGYPRIVKLWKRGTPLSSARTVFEGKTEDVASSGRSEILSDGRYDIVTRTPAFFRHESFLLLGDRLVKLDLPEDSRLRAFFRDRLLFSLRSDWTVGGRTYRAGSLLAGSIDDILRGDRRFDVLFEPSERVSLAAVERTRDRVLLQTLDNVRSRITALSLEDGAWKRSEVPTPGLGTADFAATSDFTDTFFFTYEDFSTPTSLWLAEKRRGAGEGQDDAGVLRRERRQDRAVRGHVEGRHEDPVLRRDAEGVQGRRNRPDAPLRLRRLRGLGGPHATAAPSGPRGSPGAASTSSRTSAAAESSAPPGTRRP